MSNNAVNPVPLGLPALAGSPLLQYDRADRCFVTTTRRTPIYPRGGSWVRAEGSNPQIVAHQQLVSYYQRHPPAHPEDVFAILRINVEPAQTTENLQSPVNEQPFELPDVQYVPIEAPELPPAPPAPTNAPVEVPMAMFTQADIDQRIAVALAAYQSQQSTANRPLHLDIPAPEPFSGKAEDLRRFIQCILSYFVATNNTRLSNEAKIAFTVALMRKDLGKTWADAYYEKSAGGVQCTYIANTKGTNSSVPALQWAVLVLTDAWTSTCTFPSSPHPSWLPVKARFMHSTLRTSSTSTSQMALRLSSTVANSSRAPTGHLDRSQKITLTTKRSDERNTRSGLEAPSLPDLPHDILALSPPAPAFLKLSSPVQVKREEISLQTLHQSLSLRRVRVKKESRSPSPRILLGPPRRQRSPPRQQSLTGGPPQPPPPPRRPPSPPAPIMSSPATAPNKETLKLLLPLRYDGKTIIECNRFLSQLRIYWLVALSLLNGDARAWATPYFAQLVSVQIGAQGAMTPFRNEAAFAAAFKARFGNLDDKAAAQVELAKLCADKSVREKRTAAEFSALFKGPADRSRYGDLELRDKYLSGIPSHVYRKIELETFTTWQAAEKRATEVEQILNISRARRPELNNFFSARGQGRGGARGGAPQSHTASASINAAVGKGNFPGTCFGCGKQGY
ncbi:predicted protein [Postia placenta Mad-698-R]|nr:predicted protein [Postia placenta Mad-698-R]